MNIDNFVKEINNKRKKGGWYQFLGLVEGKEVSLKGYKTWLQVYRVDGVDYGNCCDRSVADFKADLIRVFTRDFDCITSEHLTIMSQTKLF